MKLFIKEFFSKCDQNRSFLQIWFPVDLVTFTEEILNGKLYFLCSVLCQKVCKLKFDQYCRGFSLRFFKLSLQKQIMG